MMRTNRVTGSLFAATRVGWFLLLSAAGCSTGAGTAADIGQSYGDSPGGFGRADRPTVDNQDSPRAPVRTVDNPGSKAAGQDNATKLPSSGGTSTKDGCPPCNGPVTCDITSNGTTLNTDVLLSLKNGLCTATSSSTELVFACGGQLTISGQTVGTWSNCSSSKSSGGSAVTPDAGASKK